jgi:general secretion pathway protein E
VVAKEQEKNQAFHYEQMPSLQVDTRWLLDKLVEQGRLDPQDANLVAGTQRTKAQLKSHGLQIIADAQLIDQKNEGKILDLVALTNWLEQLCGMPKFHIDPLKVNVPAVTAVMSYNFSERHHILAVAVDEEEVTIATTQPYYTDWQDGLKQILGDKKIKRVLVNPEDMYRFRIEFYNLAKSVFGATESAQNVSKVGNFEQLLEIGTLKNPDANDQHIVNIVDWILQYAFDQRASDIHLEPRREIGNLRLRIDGVLHNIYDFPANVTAAITSRIKILGRMNVAEKRKPQDGRLKTVTSGGNEVELRLSTLPTAFGEKLVMRIFDPDVLLRSFKQLGLGSDEFERWKSWIANPNGIILVTGPTGSGKTTTLYSTLRTLATEQVNVCTIEDPIEMVEPKFNQMQIQRNQETDFASGVRALMRQDPDIIMIGEIRDLETADMAIQASLTGHLVLSTLHTNDAPSSLTRLLDLGIPSYLITSTLTGIMAQRLVRTLCPHCKEESETDEAGWEQLVKPWKAKAPKTTFHPVGCLECRNTGYMGRIGIYEMLSISESIKNLVEEEFKLGDLRKMAYKEGMRTLRLSGAQKVANGLTTIEEVMRVTPQHAS